MIEPHAVVIRRARPADERALVALAVIDSSRALAGTVLLAEVDGVVRAALDLDSGRAIADPFAPTADLVEMLRLRASRLAIVSRDDRVHMARRRAHGPLRAWGARRRAAAAR